MLFFFFFFSSRRRHTSCLSDWSSDVCSSDLAVEAVDQRGKMYLLESEYLAEVLTPGANTPAPPGEFGELVVTNLGRIGSPLIRYRTGDLVQIGRASCRERQWIASGSTEQRTA